MLKAMKLRGEGGEAEGRFQLSSLLCAFGFAFPVKCVSVVFDSSSDKTLGVRFPQHRTAVRAVC